MPPGGSPLPGCRNGALLEAVANVPAVTWSWGDGCCDRQPRWLTPFDSSILFLTPAGVTWMRQGVSLGATEGEGCP